MPNENCPPASPPFNEPRMENPFHQNKMEDLTIENAVNTIIQVDAPVINPVTVIDVDVNVDVGVVDDGIIKDHEAIMSKKGLPSIFHLNIRLLTGTCLLMLLIIPTLGAGYIKYRLRREMYKSVVLNDDFPSVDYESKVPIKIHED